MPTILCPSCTRPTTLPDPWPHPSYTCPHCGAVVALSATPPLPPPSSPPPAPLPPSEPQYVHTTYADHTTAGSTFGRVFGGSMGCLAALVVAFFALILVCSGAFSGGSPTSPR